MNALHELGDQRYRVSLSEAGGGLSRRGGVALNRWPGDALEDAHGFFIYLRDCGDGALWSAGLQPAGGEPEHYRVQADAQRVTIERRERGIDSTLAVEVDAAASCETRRLRLHNTGARPRAIEITSYIEIALAEAEADLNHPAFLKLFVQTQRDARSGALVARRRPRAQGETWPLAYHALLDAPVSGWETDRARFIGRGRSVAAPAMSMTRTLGNVLDPVFSLRTRIELAPGQARELRWLLGTVDDVAELAQRLPPAPPPQPAALSEPPPPPIQHGFADQGREYRIRLPWTGDGLALPPMPWINVIAQPGFGFLASETGAGCSWSGNSQLDRLTPWSNDPVCDPHGEALYLRDEDSGAFWSPLPGPAPAPVDYEVHHGFGYSRYDCEFDGIVQRTTLFAARGEPLKIATLVLANRGAVPRRLSVFAYQRLLLGSRVPARLLSGHDDGTLHARRSEGGGPIVYSALIGGDESADAVCGDRAGFVGRYGSLRAPRALRERRLGGALGDGLDPCFARQRSLLLQPGETQRLHLLLGTADSDAQRRAAVARYRAAGAAEAALEQVRAFWRERLDSLQLRTPAPEIDALLGGWLAYQAVSCRLWARTAFYQSSGACGYRDQLQDAGNLAMLWPELTRAQIRLHARRQFVEGDVLHWWHEAPLRGLRTRFSDDLLWLPYVTLDYLRATGDAALLDEQEPFLQAPLLEAGEDERYLQPGEDAGQASIYEHCCRAIDRSLTCGAHGLPLMGTGDWNDGMNRVGRLGRGESVWLGFFLYRILGGFAPLAARRGDAARAARYAACRERLREALEDAGWDGAWYRRAYYDDGTPLGTAAGDECRIDGLVQAWAVLSGAAPRARAEQAMDATEAQLVDEQAGLIRLLTPPFVDTPHDPGYIRGYVAGVRENGGQYTHAACWVIAALAALGRRERAARLLARLSGVWHTRDARGLARYQVEPYVIAADIYGAEPHIGRGGWTWYTGSAGWALRVGLESVLGVALEQGRWLVVKPCIPDDWPAFTLSLRPFGAATRYQIEIVNPEGCAATVVAVDCDGVALDPIEGAARLRLHDDGALHRLRVLLGAPRT